MAFTTPLAPSRIYSSVSVLLIRAVMKTTGMSRPEGDSRKWRNVAGPSISGIITSSRMVIQLNRQFCPSASRPADGENLQAAEHFETKPDDLQDVILVVHTENSPQRV